MYTSLINAAAAAGHWEQALEVFLGMQCANVSLGLFQLGASSWEQLA